MNPTRFRGGIASPAGLFTPYLFEGKVTGQNLRNWTVDVASSHDRKYYTDIQVASPYAHYAEGEGFFCMPEFGAKCLVCIPSDTSPPAVLAFVMPFQALDTAADDAPTGTTSRSGINVGTATASFAGNRPRRKSGDIGFTGRDGNFVICHRGGILQLGGGLLSQRICIPLSNTIVDICENMTTHTDGGTMNWGLQPTADERLPTGFMQSFRLFADNKYADMCIKASRVSDPIRVSDSFELEKDLAMGSIIYDVTIAPQGFETETGAVHDSSTLRMRFSFDETGNTLLASKASLSIHFQKDIFVRTEGLFSLATKRVQVEATDGMVLNGGSLTHVKGSVVKLGPGASPVAYQGSPVEILFPYTPQMGAPTPFRVPGFITLGRPGVLV